ncbi:MAG: enoyl-CoA hydratase/isomerase family protein [Deltaproteobacteria bacterium]|nr:enoyl-CoA hydratase/isomerase family protein [Deltaproteobacteria bacterium]
MTYETVAYSKQEGIGVLRLNRPERMNAVIEEMYIEIQDVLMHAQEDEEVRVLILTGSVLKKDGREKQAFCAGADLKKHSAGERTHQQKREYILLAHETTRRIYEFAKPVIAAVNGPARGAGAEMAVSCDFIFMAEEATLAFPETGLGTFVGGGVTFHLSRIVGLARAKDLVYSGRVIDGRAALETGLAFRRFPVATLMEEALAYAKSLSEKAPVSMRQAKQRLQQSPALDLETMLLLEAEGILTCMDTEDWHEGIRSFDEKRKPIFRGR